MSMVNKSEKVTFSILGSGLLHFALAAGVLMMNAPAHQTSEEPPAAEALEVLVEDPQPIMKTEIPIETPEPMPAQAPVAAEKPELPKKTAVAQVLPQKTIAKSTTVSPAIPKETVTTVAVPAASAAIAMNENQDDADSGEAEEAPAQEALADLPETDLVMEESEVLAAKARQAEMERAAALAAADAEKRAREIEEIEKKRVAREEQERARAEQQEREQAEVRTRAAALAAQQAAAQAAQQDSASESIEGDNDDSDVEEAAGPAPQGPLQGAPGFQGPAQTGQVRALEELKQMPGNQKPQYDSEDRLAGRQGDVIFRAYVSTEGMPTDFKMVRSSGHRSLDYKTLKAIKSWKFYPGQEGWVEIPFRWDLKGGPKQIGGTLRTKVSQQ